MKSLIIGNGRSGKAADAFLQGRGDATEVVDGIDLVVVSPGVRVMSELEFGVRELRKLGVRLIGVTGSKGKSSVVKLVAEALGGVPCGNYGLPVTELATRVKNGEKVRWAVVEVSSFQLETTNLPEDAFEAAAILNLQEDHLDRHGSREAYHAVKRRLLSMAKVSFDCEAPDAGDLLSGSYFDNAVLRANGAIAAALMRSAGLDDAAIRAAFKNFSPLPHRMQQVGVFGGVRCIDDSKATSLAALAAGVEMSGTGIRLIAGGLPKGDDPKSITYLLTKRVKKVYLIGRSAEEFFRAWSGSVDCEICETMENAVKASMREARQGETILLSPGTASFDQFKSFGERGDVFADLVNKEGKNR
jgi:UDP-N-acetylmuramoylalanine--D-glutamate ligase